MPVFRGEELGMRSVIGPFCHRFFQPVGFILESKSHNIDFAI